MRSFGATDISAVRKYDRWTIFVGLGHIRRPDRTCAGLAKEAVQ